MALHDDSRSETLKSASPSFEEKAKVETSAEPSRSQSPFPEQTSIHNGVQRVVSSKEAQAELTKIMTSGEGIEYPTGIKLHLISLALCLAVLLIALVCKQTSSSDIDEPILTAA